MIWEIVPGYHKRSKQQHGNQQFGHSFHRSWEGVAIPKMQMGAVYINICENVPEMLFGSDSCHSELIG